MAALRDTAARPVSTAAATDGADVPALPEAAPPPAPPAAPPPFLGGAAGDGSGKAEG